MIMPIIARSGAIAKIEPVNLLLNVNGTQIYLPAISTHKNDGR